MTGYLPLSFMAGDVPVLGPIGIAIDDLGTTSQQVLAGDPVRRGLVFHNPGAVSIRLAPANLTPVAGAGGILLYGQSDLILLEGDDNMFNLNCAWKAVADSGADNPLTIFNFTDNNQSVPAPNAVSRLNVNVPITSPNGIAIAALATASQQVIGANPNRRGILFQNPGSEIVAVCPANLDASISAGSWIILPGQERRILAKGRVRVNCAWNAIAAAGIANKLTILEFL